MASIHLLCKINIEGILLFFLTTERCFPLRQTESEKRAERIFGSLILDPLCALKPPCHPGGWVVDHDESPLWAEISTATILSLYSIEAPFERLRLWHGMETVLWRGSISSHLNIHGSTRNTRSVVLFYFRQEHQISKGQEVWGWQKWASILWFD